MTGSTSSSLLDAVKAGDPDAWLRLSNLYGPEVYGWLRGAGLQDHDAADVLQEVFGAVAASIHNFRQQRPEDSFRGWLWTITRNCLRQHLRREGKEPHGAGGEDSDQQLQLVADAPADSVAPAPLRTSALALRALELIRTDFHESTWKAFWQTAVEERAAADVAADLNLSVASVYTAKSRVLARLREELGDLID